MCFKKKLIYFALLLEIFLKKLKLRVKIVFAISTLKTLFYSLASTLSTKKAIVSLVCSRFFFSFWLLIFLTILLLYCDLYRC